MKGKFARKPLSSLKRFRTRNRRRTDAELRALASSWLRQPVHPIVCRPDLTVADGNERLDGLELLGETEVEVFITDEELTDDQLTEIGFITAYHRAPLGGFDQADAVRKIKACTSHCHQQGVERTVEDRSVRADAPALAVHHASPKCRRRAQAGNLGPSEWHSISQAAPAEQAALLAMKLGGMTRDDLARESRKRRNGETPAVRTVKLSIPLASGQKVTVTGNEVSLDEAIDALSEALKEARRAREQNLNAKTFAAMMKDKSRAVAPVGTGSAARLHRDHPFAFLQETSAPRA